MYERIRTREGLIILLNNVNRVAQYALVTRDLTKTYYYFVEENAERGTNRSRSARIPRNHVIQVTFGSRTFLMVYILAIACRDPVRSEKRSRVIRAAVYAVEKERTKRVRIKSVKVFAVLYERQEPLGMGA